MLVFGPFAFGSVHPRAYGILEIVAALLLVVWLAKLRFGGSHSVGSPVVPRAIWVPTTAFVGIVLLQILPLPPSVIRALSPGAYGLYAASLPGWPDEAPYEDTVRDVLAHDDAGVQASDLSRSVSLPGVDEVEKQPLASFVPDVWGHLLGEPFLDRVERRRLETWVEADTGSSWRTLSIDPAKTSAELLKILAYLACFAVVAFYPITGGARDDARFQRRVLRAVAFTAVAVAAVGLLQRFAWNGKLLWFFVPWDWTAAHVGDPQTSGPFVSRNNFGGYLALTLPLVLVPVLTPSQMDHRGRRCRTQIVFGGGAALVSIALVFSLSRGAWIASAVSLALLLVGLTRAVPREKRAAFLRSRNGGLGAAAAVALALVLLILVPSGGPGRGNDVERRLRQTVSSTASLDARMRGWRDSLPMVSEFPAFGVGLGAWGEAFPRYDRSFYFGTQFGRAHNDYLQLVAEVGFVGGSLLFVALAVVGLRLRRAVPERPHRSLVVSMAIGAGLVALLVHELVDFDLQMPGIAVTAIVLAAIGLRGRWEPRAFRSPVRGLGSIAGLGAGVFVAIVLTQPASVAPGDPGIAGALSQVERTPARSSAHLRLAVELAELSPSLARRALDAAVALNPVSPGPRDARVVVLAQLGERDIALREIEESMFWAPSTTLHPLLAARAATWLPADSRSAVERGFTRAVDGGAGFRAAIALASFRSSVRERRAAAAAWEQAANLAPRATSAVLLEHAGRELAWVDDLDEAEVLLRRSIEVDPAAFGPRSVLIAQVLGRRADIHTARREVVEGTAAGADAYELELAFGEAAFRAEDVDLERSVLESAVRRRPGDERAHYRLGLSWYREKQWTRAARSLEVATRLGGGTAPAWFYLALALERGGEFHAAARAFARAVAAAPENLHYREQRERFVARLEAG